MTGKDKTIQEAFEGIGGTQAIWEAIWWSG